MSNDVILIHPPSVYDFRKKAIFSGPIAYTVGGSGVQFVMPSVGSLSIAEYLTRHGYSAYVDNIGERMMTDPEFNVEKYIGGLKSRVFAVELHWVVHSQGAIEIARLCKKLHPEAMVVLGGLTATVFHEQILHKYDFVDGILRGETEKPFLQLIRALDEQNDLETVPNLAYRDQSDEIKINPLMEPDDNLDDYEFTNLELLEPKRSIFVPGTLSSWVIPVCRGCIHNCVSCGGSAYSYRIYLGRKKPAFRSPEKIVQDLQKLGAQGVQLVFLFQDPHMGGREYWTHLLKVLQNNTIPLRQLTMEIFGPVEEEYMQELAKIKVPIVLTISPESGVDSVRGAHGRKYSNEMLFKTYELSKKYGIKLGSFSMLALANDTPETIKQTWESWEEICKMHVDERTPVDYAFGPMILLDPGSLAFDRSNSYGYRLLFKNFEDIVNRLSLPSWHQWISYETKFLDREAIIQQTIDSLEYSINLRERAGFFSQEQAEIARYCFVEASKETVNVVNAAMRISSERKRAKRLLDFQESLEQKLDFLQSKLRR